MRQFFTWRFWASIAVLVAIGAVLASVVTRSNDGSAGVASSEVSEHRVDLGALVVAAEPGDGGWGFSDGVTVGVGRLVLDDGTTMTIASGTVGESTCDDLAQLGACAVVADLLGEAVVWFALVPAGRGQEVTLPPVEDVLDAGREARLVNGWVVPLVDRVERRCDLESTSFRDFLARFGTDHDTVYDLSLDEVSALVCRPDPS